MIYQAILFFSLFTSCLCEDTIEAFYFKSGGDGVSGDLHLNNDKSTPDTENITTQEHTFCVRYKPTIYESYSHMIYKIEFTEEK